MSNIVICIFTIIEIQSTLKKLRDHLMLLVLLVVLYVSNIPILKSLTAQKKPAHCFE